MEDEENIIKVTLLGNAGVGKTCIIIRYALNEFNSYIKPSLICNFYQKILNIDGKKMQINLWDTVGQEQYRSLGRLFYQDSHIVVFVYDITNRESFLDIKNTWYNDLKTYGEKYIITALVGNKSDCYEEEQVDENEAREYAKQIGAHYFSVSAKTRNNIDLLFMTLVKEYLGPEFSKKLKKIKEEKVESVKMSNKMNKKKKHRCCM